MTTWLVEYGTQPPKRPPTSTILDRLNEEVDNWATVGSFLDDGTGSSGADLEDEAPDNRPMIALPFTQSFSSHIHPKQTPTADLPLPGSWTASGHSRDVVTGLIEQRRPCDQKTVFTATCHVSTGFIL